MRGGGNHKIPASFAPENMEKTGAERVKYSLACQHEDAISIKCVSYAQKCPTVLCTFAVALRKESVDRKSFPFRRLRQYKPSLSARRAWIEKSASGRRGTGTGWSLSARRAWIENTQFVPITTSDVVALRKESVDRKGIRVLPRSVMWLSLPARRAWIEK